MNYYTTIPSWILSKKIPPSEKLMCVLLSALSQKDGFCYANNKYLAESLGTSEGAVIKIINRLSSIDMIAIINKKTKIIGNRKIYLKFVEINESDKTSNDDDQNDIGDLSEDPIESKFDLFYNLYPRREKRVLALKMFKSKKLHNRIDDLLSATKRYIAEKEGTEVKFLMLPATFLNNEIWEEYVGSGNKKISNAAGAEDDQFEAFVRVLRKFIVSVEGMSWDDISDHCDEAQLFDNGSAEQRALSEYGGLKWAYQHSDSDDFKSDLYAAWESVK